MAPRAKPLAGLARVTAPREPSATIGARAGLGTRSSWSSSSRGRRDPPLAMSTVIDSLERSQLRRVPRFDAGDRLRVHFQVTEGTRRRTQVFEGVVIKRQGHGVRETFTVRKQSFGVGVERTFPIHSPKIERIEVAARGDVRRAKLYYLRERVGKRARVRERRSLGPEEVGSARTAVWAGGGARGGRGGRGGHVAVRGRGRPRSRWGSRCSGRDCFRRGRDPRGPRVRTG